MTDNATILCRSATGSTAAACGRAAATRIARIAITMVDSWRILIAWTMFIARVVLTVLIVAVAIVVLVISLWIATVYAEIVLGIVVMMLAATDGVMTHIAVIALIAPTGAVVVARSAVIVGAAIGSEATGCIIVEETVIAIDAMDAECPISTRAVNRTEEVVTLHEHAILTTGEYVAEILISLIQQFIVLVDSVAITANYIVHYTVDSVYIIEIDFVNVIILSWGQIEFVSHAVAQEAGIGTDTAG